MAGDDANAVEVGSGRPALHVAVALGSAGVVAALLAHGADAAAREAVSGLTAREYAGQLGRADLAALLA